MDWERQENRLPLPALCPAPNVVPVTCHSNRYLMNFAQQPIDALKAQGQKLEKELRATQESQLRDKNEKQKQPYS